MFMAKMAFNIPKQEIGDGFKLTFNKLFFLTGLLYWWKSIKRKDEENEKDSFVSGFQENFGLESQ